MEAFLLHINDEPIFEIQTFKRKFKVGVIIWRWTWYFKIMTNPGMSKSMLVWDVGDGLFCRQLWDIGDRVELLVAPK